MERDWYYFHKRVEYLSKAINNFPKKIMILDFGCGTGEFSKFLIKKGFKNVISFDFSTTLIKSAKQKRLQNLFIANGEMLPIKSNTFDFVILLDVIEHLPNRKKALREVHRVLKRKGKVFLTYPNPSWVPILILMGKLGFMMEGDDRMIFLSTLKREIKKTFIIEDYGTSLLFTKLSNKNLKKLEKIEKKLPAKLMNCIGIIKRVTLRKLD